MGPSTAFFPLPTVLIGTGTVEESDVTAVAWMTVATATPPSFAIALRDSRRSLEQIRATGELTVNLPNRDLVAETDYCGLVSGRNAEKAKVAGLVLEQGAKVTAPIVTGCKYSFECKVTAEYPLGEYALVIAEIVETQADEDALTEHGQLDIGKIAPLVYCGGLREYREIGQKVADAYKVGRPLLADE